MAIWVSHNGVSTLSHIPSHHASLHFNLLSDHTHTLSSLPHHSPLTITYSDHNIPSYMAIIWVSHNGVCLSSHHSSLSSLPHHAPFPLIHTLSLLPLHSPLIIPIDNIPSYMAIIWVSHNHNGVCTHHTLIYTYSRAHTHSLSSHPLTQPSDITLPDNTLFHRSLSTIATQLTTLLHYQSPPLPPYQSLTLPLQVNPRHQINLPPYQPTIQP